MSGPFSVDLDRLDGVVGDIEAFEKHVDEQLARLDRHLTALQRYWTGDTADAESAAHTEWMSGAHEMRTGLAALKAAARTAHTNYARAVSANLQMWQF